MSRLGEYDELRRAEELARQRKQQFIDDYLAGQLS